MTENSGMYRMIPHVSKPVSRIIYGTATADLKAGRDRFDVLDGVMAMGVNTFDLARVYGEAEACLGRWMAERGNRERLVLLSKCAHPHKGVKRVTEEDIREDFRVTSEKLGTDYIDIYLLHRDDESKDVSLAVEVMNALHAEGKIGAFGGSNWSHRRIEEANEYAYKRGLIPFSVSSPNFGLAEKAAELLVGGVSIAGPGNEEARGWYADNQMPVIAYSSLARGFLSGKLKSVDRERVAQILNQPTVKEYACEGNFERLRRCELLAAKKGCTVAQTALAWLLGQSVNAFAVVSASEVERMRSNVAAMELRLTEKEMNWLDLKGGL